MFKYFVITADYSKHIKNKLWFNECMPITRLEGHDDPGEDSWMVPVERQNDLTEDPAFLRQTLDNIKLS